MQNGPLRRLFAISCIAFFLSIIPPGFASATVGIGKSWGQTVYAASYSYILVGESGWRFPITSTVVVRNTDLTREIRVTSVDYRDSKGGHLRHLVKKPEVLGPLSSQEFTLEQSDETGGHSPSFLVHWEADEWVNAPVIEVILIGKSGTQGLSFVGRAWVIEEAEAPDAAVPESAPVN